MPPDVSNPDPTPGASTTPEDMDALMEARARVVKEILRTQKGPGDAATPPRGTPEPLTVHLTQSTFPEFLRRNERVVVDVWAPWCGPCRQLAPTLDSLARDLQGKVRFAKVNADEEPVLSAQFGVQGIPTLLFFRGGKLAGRSVGLQPKGALLAQIQRSLGPLGGA